ncbi:hypothetical protein A2957_02690 [Candidatus Roizmanbacteria bacterium RIFCSPLOWO2_01_FULL_38_11]|uniref:Glycosyltransferase subfamily 4-like N-terminal domain-containing protein n=1 Tax=Candidatus Roizmanbacteria bacterium RIFCSPLOWO2_01_FULL_38_11 TaxID=1802060 RepID=A0A1F7INQ4_9BACT|nr:MAG: hypothetical protein A2957_02690 [Candidatus Roizmanbacteria bacterium RIFCSPLOWO2_01_FULL_38_11]
MKILMLTPYLPYPPSSGGQVRSYNLIKHLSKNHEIYLVSLIKNEEEKRYHKGLLKYCSKIYTCKRSESPWTISNIFKSVFGRYPFLVVRNFSEEARLAVADLLKKEDFDLIHAETFYIMPHIPKTKTPILLVEQTIEYRVYQHFVKQLPRIFRPLFHFDIRKLKYWEVTFWKRADLVGAVSADDQKKMDEILPGVKTCIIPNAAGEDLLDVYEKRKRRTPHPIFLYQGNFAWLQNVEAARILINTIFPEIKKRIPKAQCIIAGQRAKEKVGTIQQDGIQIVDILSSEVDKVIDVYSKASIFLAPIEGPGGTRLKILGAMAAGLPVISSKTGVSGLDVIHGKNVMIAQSNEEFSELAEEILNDKEKYHLIQTNARLMIEKKYSWTTVARELEKIYRQLI